MVDFAGWQLPVQYSGVSEEVRAVREGCGVFDVSHMGQFDIEGPEVTPALSRVVSADWSRVTPGRVGYALLLNERGGVIDDVMGYHLEEEQWLVIANASRASGDEAHMRSILSGVRLANRYPGQAMLAIQGPRAQEKLLPLLEGVDLVTMNKRDCTTATLAGAPGLIARGGYTGSDGFEFIFRAEHAEGVWYALLQAGVTPCGLGARDVLRLEACLPLYGHELREEWTPYESSCGWAVKLEKGEFVGREALVGYQASRCIQPLKMRDRAIPREGYEIVQSGSPIGHVTSGTMSATVGSGIALAMLPTSLTTGDQVDVVIRNSGHPAEIVPRPFVPHA